MAHTGAQVIIEMLRRQGARDVFGYPGGSVLPLFDAIYEAKDLNFYLVRHEQGAAHAADGYARATGRPGVCIATSGPGATNLVTGIATAYMDSIPIVAITGQVKTHLIGNDAFQEADITGITRPITKHNYLVKDVADLPLTLKEAFYIASTGRPGPVLVDIPVDVTTAKFEGEFDPPVRLPGYEPPLEGNVKQIKRVAEALAESKRPVLYVGGGAITSAAWDDVAALAHRCEIPVTTTLMGLGAFPETDELSLGMLGMHGTAYANHAVMNADLLIAVGARFDDRVTGRLDAFAPDAKVVHMDIDPTAISKNIQVDIPVVGDARRILQALLKYVKDCRHPEWLAQISEWRTKHPLTYSKKGRLKPQFVVEKIHDVTKGEAVICTEVGQNQMWAAQFYTHTKPRHFISSGGLGTMGYGFPAAIGAQVGRPEAMVFDIAGDGSIQMNIQELCTAVQYKLPVKVAILNNGFLGMVRQWQELFYGRRYSQTSLHCQPDFVKLAEAYGAVGMRIEKTEEVEPALKAAVANGRPTFMDFRVEPEENVWPMVPAGGKIDEMIGPKEPELL